MSDRPRWLPYRAKDGILETFFSSADASASFFAYVERAIDWAQGAERGSYRLLDTFLSDSLDIDVICKILQISNSSCPARILVVDPSSDFALARAKSIGQIAAKEVRVGICNILMAIGKVIRIELPDLSLLTFDQLVHLTHKHASKVYLEIRFYSEVPSGPLYFFNDILLAGRFCAGLSSSKLPWTMIVDDPHYTGDLYDVCSEEFERIWGKAHLYPEQDLGSVESEVPLDRRLFDLGIITATEVEWDSLRNLPGVCWERLTQLSEGGSILYGSHFERDGRRLSVVATRQSKPGMVCAAIAATKMLQLCRVNFIAIIGICAAVPGKARLGSIVVADQVFDSQGGKVIGGMFQPDVDSIALDVSLFQMIKDKIYYYADEADKACSKFKRPKRVGEPVTGKVATVSQVIADSSVAQQAKGHSRQTVAIEMESYAILRAAAEEKSERRPRTFFVKVAADYADDRKNDRYQRYCAEVSAHFVWNFSLEHLAQ